MVSDSTTKLVSIKEIIYGITAWLLRLIQWIKTNKDGHIIKLIQKSVEWFRKQGGWARSSQSKYVVKKYTTGQDKRLQITFIKSGDKLNWHHKWTPDQPNSRDCIHLCSLYPPTFKKSSNLILQFKDEVISRISSNELMIIDRYREEELIDHCGRLMRLATTSSLLW